VRVGDRIVDQRIEHPRQSLEKQAAASEEADHRTSVVWGDLHRAEVGDT
jgi:hypothetical protein